MTDEGVLHHRSGLLATLRALLRSQDVGILTATEQRAAACLLLPLAEAEVLGDSERKLATDLLERLISVGGDATTEALLALWLSGFADRRTASAGLWAASEEIARPVQDLVLKMRDVDAPGPVLRWLGDRDQLAAELQQGVAAADLPHGMDRSDEKRVWQNAVQPVLQPVLQALVDGKRAELEVPDDKTVAGWAHDAANQGGGRRTYFEKQVWEHLDALHDLVELQGRVQPWRPVAGYFDDLPDLLAEMDEQHRAVAHLVLRWVLVEASERRAETVRLDTEVAQVVEGLAATAGADDRLLLAQLTAARPAARGAAALTSVQRRAEQVVARGQALGETVAEVVNESLEKFELVEIEEFLAGQEAEQRVEAVRIKLATRAAALASAPVDSLATELREEAERRLAEGQVQQASAALDAAEHAAGIARRLAELRADVSAGPHADLLDCLADARTTGELASLEEAVTRARGQLAERTAAERSTRFAALVQQLQDLVAGDNPLLAEARWRQAQDLPLLASDVDELADRLGQAEVAQRQIVQSSTAGTRVLLEETAQQLNPGDREQVARTLAEAEQARDAGRLLQAYLLATRARTIVERRQVPMWKMADGEKKLVEHLVRYVQQFSGIAAHDVRRLHVALKTKPFVILAGLTGSGKSAIARLYAEALHATGANGRFVRIAVRPNWVDESEVLGYLNPVSNRFQPGFLAVLVRACERDPDLPFFCLLDEMNLAPVEQYLADVLSAMEEVPGAGQRPVLRLYSAGLQPVNAEQWPSELPLPENLLIVGTVNVDETARALSDRVLDRASVLQLATKVTRGHHAERRAREPRENAWVVRWEDWRGICRVAPSDLAHDLLVDVAEAFHEMGIGLGLRAHLEVERYLANAEGVLDVEDALDLALLQRVVPKIHGYKRDLLVGLEQLRPLLDSAGCRRCLRVVDDWIADRTSDDSFLDGIDVRVGLLGQ